MLSNKIELHIERLVYGGKGLGRHNNMVVFVPDVITGEKVLVEIRTRKKDYAEAELIQVLEPSPHRITPPCPIYHDCGGCQWMHMDYPFQVQAKREVVAEIGCIGSGLHPAQPKPIADIPPACLLLENLFGSFAQSGSRHTV